MTDIISAVQCCLNIRAVVRINIDGIIGAEYVSRFVCEHAGSIFNQSGMTEKPDIVSAKILEGRVALFVDGTPVVITYPYVLLESFQDGYDYYVQNKRATMLRIIRIIGAFLAVLLPGLYVAFQEYHYQLMQIYYILLYFVQHLLNLLL